MKEPKRTKFNFEEMKAGATSPNPALRKKTFQEYFDRFEEFPSYLFDSDETVDSRLQQTIQELTNDPTTPKTMQKAIQSLMERLPSLKNANGLQSV